MKRQPQDKSLRDSRREYSARDQPQQKTSGGKELKPGERIATTSARVDSHLYGVSPILEALRSGRRKIERITIADRTQQARLRELISLAKRANVPVHYAPRADLVRLVGAEVNHQGVVATVAAAAYADAGDLLDALGSKAGAHRSPLVVVLDGVEDPRNLGAVIRTAECAGVHCIFLPERRAVGLTETVAKSAAGALEHIPVARVVNLARLIEQLKERNIWIVGTSADATTQYTDWDWTLPSALFLGGEGSGLHRLVKERCDTLVRIPVLGQIESLNVSVAAGIVLYEAVRQRGQGRQGNAE